MGGKAERTREALVETALRLFRERGYAATTMRLVADEAGLSTGNAYYHFAGKDALVQELYAQIQAEHRMRALPLIEVGDPVGDNLRRVLRAGLEVMAPYHSFGATMVSTALRPSPVSPFSAESAASRGQAVALMSEVVAASKGMPRRDLGEKLPHLLWLAYLAVTLHWVSDQTPGQRRTHELVDGLAPVIGRALGLARLPVGRGLARDIVALVDRLASHPDPTRSSP